MGDGKFGSAEVVKAGAVQKIGLPLHEAIDRIVKRLAADPNSISGQS